MKNEFKILLCLACLLLVLEAGARVFETRLSKDVQHLRQSCQRRQRSSAPQARMRSESWSSGTRWRVAGWMCRY